MTTIHELTLQIRQFADERDWEQFHTVRNLVLALSGEVGELAAEIQWVSDADISSHFKSSDKREMFVSEAADVAIYLLRLCDVAGIDLAAAIRDKLILNASRYRVDKSRGSSAKYTELDSI